MQGKIPIKSRGGQKYQIKIRYLIIALAVIFSASGAKASVVAENCPDLRVVFARGSGGERWNTDDYFEFKNTLESKLETVDLDYEFIDLDYPAAAIGMKHLGTTIGAYVGAGESYEFGESVKTGAQNLSKLVNNSCPGTKYVVGGYSQGAMVVSKALPSLNADKLIYVATFGDPKIYLPEGEGLIPAACRGENLSDYRAYVPDCQAYKGLLGANIPYEPAELAGKVGTWCNRRDVFCSSRFGISDHLEYISDGLYEDASKVMFNKITQTFGLENTVSSPHDTVILIDSTGSMSGLIDAYKAEALRLAEQTLDAGGRVALYDYRDLNDPYQPVEHCNFETCDLDMFRSGLENITANGGGDEQESMLSAAFTTMKTLKWKKGATKSMVVLTDAGFLSPDRDGITTSDVIELSREIDPVNFYIITEPGLAETYRELADKTDGKVVTDLGELELLTNYILERDDNLPPVEENSEHVTYTIEITDAIRQDDGSFLIKFENSGTQALVVLNDTIMGITNQNELIIGELNSEVENVLALVPLAEEVRGEAAEVKLVMNSNNNVVKKTNEEMILPKAPNTGTR